MTPRLKFFTDPMCYRVSPRIRAAQRCAAQGGVSTVLRFWPGQFSIRINRQWRICFEWLNRQMGPSAVVIVDYH